MKPFRLNGDLPRLICDGYQLAIDATSYSDGTVTIERWDFDSNLEKVILACFSGPKAKANALAEFERLCEHMMEDA